MTEHDILIIGIKSWTTGQRPDGIDNDDIRNGNLICEAGSMHQRLDSEDYGDFEIRKVMDDRDISQYDSWTLHFADGSTLNDADGREAIVGAVQDSKQPTDLDGVIPVSASEVDLVNNLIKKALPTQYHGNRESVKKWAEKEGVDLGIEWSMQDAYSAGCPYIEAVEPPEV